MPIKSIIEEIAADEIIDAAYLWLCKRRKDWLPIINYKWRLRPSDIMANGSAGKNKSQ